MLLNILKDNHQIKLKNQPEEYLPNTDFTLPIMEGTQQPEREHDHSLLFHAKVKKK
jgi:hypothetical protein